MTISRMILILAVLVLSAAPAYPAREQQGGVDHAAWKKISNYRGWKIRSLSLTGLDKSDTHELGEGLELAEKDAVLYERILNRDIDRIRLFLALRGYPYSSVSPVVSPEENRREIGLTIGIDPGQPVIVEDLEITGLPDPFMETTLESVKMNAGEVFSDAAVTADESAIIEILMEAGHARAEAVSRVEMVDTTRVRVLYEISPGSVYYFDSFRVSGASEDLNRLASIALNIERGERFAPETMTDARDNLSGLQLFGQIRISLEDTAPDSLEMVIELSERKHRVLELAGGYWSDDGFSARVRWRHANLFKGGRGSSLEISYTQYKQSGKWVSWWPVLFYAKMRGLFILGYDNINEDSYEKTYPGIGLGLSYSHTRKMKSSLGYSVEWAKYDIYTTEKDNFQDPEGPVGYMLFRFIRDGTDDRINPTKGTYSWLRLEYGPKGGISNSNYFLGEISGTIHIPVTRRLGLAANLNFGSASPITPSTMLLPDKRFYAGGSTSHRGFERRKLGPLDENGLPLGGEVMWTGFFEIRFPLFWKFNGAAFVDAGQVWPTYGDLTWDNIEIAIGPALRIMTPVGPLRFDLGYRLTDYEPDEPGYAFHFAIGYPM